MTGEEVARIKKEVEAVEKVLGEVYAARDAEQALTIEIEKRRDGERVLVELFQSSCYLVRFKLSADLVRTFVLAALREHRRRLESELESLSIEPAAAG